MARSIVRSAACAAALATTAACAAAPAPEAAPAPAATPPAAAPAAPAAQDPTSPEAVRREMAKYTPVRLTADLSPLTANERRMIPLLIDAAREMDPIYWNQAYGDREALLASIPDADVRRYVEINYGPWDRLAGDRPFVRGIGAKPEGANYYPADMTKAEFDAAVAAGGARADSLRSLYTLVRRDAGGRLVAVPFAQAYRDGQRRAAAKLREAAALAEQASLRRYLTARAATLETDDYLPSDIAWMEMKDNRLDVVIGAIETYEDRLYGYKAAHEAYVLVKDMDWSRRLARYSSLLPSLQRGLPVRDELKREMPGSNADLNAYDVVYYAGQSNGGAKTIAINLPNDERVQASHGTRRLQLKNAMRAKFDRILLPIAQELIVPDQLRHVTFDAFFEDVMFHEVAHGLGVSTTINGRGTVREALKERQSGLEEQKADVLGLYMVSQLRARGEITGGSMDDNYVTFLASLFRSMRFGSTSAHGIANMATFNFFAERGAFSRDPATGRYRVDTAKMEQAMNALSERILTLQGTGDYDGVGEFMRTYGVIKPELQADLNRLAGKGIPVDVVFEQGPAVLGLPQD